MKANNILRTLLTCAFFFGILTMNAQTKVYVHKTDGTATEFIIADIDSISFTPPANVDYSKLKFNEISGVGGDAEKFYELINTGTTDINLEGCKIYYNNDPFNAGYTAPLTWTGCADQVIEAGELLCLIGRNVTCSFTTGLTAQRVIEVTLFDPNGNLIDEFIRAQDTGDYAISDKSFSRIPDGTGPFYFTTPSPCEINGSDATGLIKVPKTQTEGVVDYTKLKFNEISGVGGDADKFYELINTGTVDIDLGGCKIYYNNDPFNAGYTAPLTWTGCPGHVIEAGGLSSLIGRNVLCSFTTGLTAQRVIKVTLFDPDGNLIDEFLRAQDSGDYAISDKSFSRIPDGTGPFFFTEPTPDEMNGDDATGLLEVPGFIY